VAFLPRGLRVLDPGDALPLRACSTLCLSASSRRSTTGSSAAAGGGCWAILASSRR